jgi:hypothetical protein
VFIPDPDFYQSRIPDPTTATKERGGKKLVVISFFIAKNFTKIENYFNSEMLEKKICASFQRITELFTQKFVIKLSKIWVWVPGSGKNLFRIPDPDPGVNKAPGPQHCF